MAIGWVYVLTNPEMPGLAKIGQSSADPALRSSELFSTGVLSPFYVAYKGLYEDYARLERVVHAELADARHSANREFFRISIAEAVETIRQVAQSSPKYEETDIEGHVQFPPGGKYSEAAQAPPAKPLSAGALLRQRRRRSRLLANGFVEVAGQLFPKCPSCNQPVRVPENKRLWITCPSCKRAWEVAT